MGWLAKLIMWAKDNEGLDLDQLYPEHARVLKTSKLALAHYPTLVELLTSNKHGEEKEERKKKKEEGDIQRS